MFRVLIDAALGRNVGKMFFYKKHFFLSYKNIHGTMGRALKTAEEALRNYNIRQNTVDTYGLPYLTLR